MTAKLIFSDIDGTLINSKYEVTPKTRDAIRQQIMQGNIFIPVSARMPSAIMTPVSEITKVCPMVAYNGALVIDEMNRPLVSKFMPAHIAQTICKFIEEYDKSLVWNVYSGNNWFTQNKNHRVLQEEKIVKITATILANNKILALPGVHKILIMGNTEKLDQVKLLLSQKYPELFLVKSAPHLLEIMVKDVSKSFGVKILAQEFGVDLKNCLAFGDNYNDEDMLKTVGQPYLMGNAPLDLQRKFSQITADNDHDGIAKILG